MTITLLTLNLWNGGRLLENALNFINEQDADIVCLQEVYNGTDPKLEPRLRTMQVLREKVKNYRAYEFAPAMIDQFPEYDVVSGSAVLSKFPLKSKDLIFFNEPFHARPADDPATYGTLPRTLQHVEIETSAGKLQVFNIHGVWDLEGGKLTPRRVKMRDAILKAIDGKQKVILAGDTNATPDNPAVKAIEEHLVNPFHGELQTTFNMRRKTDPGYGTAAVDMIMTTPDIKVLQKTCHQEADVSDHLPLSAKMEVK